MFQKRACEHISPNRNMFGSAQCLGYRLEHGQLTHDLCYPSDDIVLKQVRCNDASHLMFPTFICHKQNNECMNLTNHKNWHIFKYMSRYALESPVPPADLIALSPGYRVPPDLATVPYAPRHTRFALLEAAMSDRMFEMTLPAP